MRIDGHFDKLEVIYVDGGTQTILDPFIRSIEWSGDVKQAYRKLRVSLANTVNGDVQIIPIKEGKAVVFREDGVELFRGVIFRYEIDSEGMAEITAYDEAVYLTKNHETKRYTKKTASAIIRELCGQFGIPVGNIADTQYVIPKLIFREKTLYDMIITALTVTQKQTGRRYFLYADKGKINLVERKTQVSKWVLEDGQNVLSASRLISIEDVRNRVKVMATDDKRKDQLLALAKDTTSEAVYGIMQHIEQVAGDVTKSQAEQRAKQILTDMKKPKEEIKLESLGIHEVTSGKAVYVKQKMTKTIGGYYVQSDSHTYENGAHTMSLLLSLTDDLPTLEYSETEDDKAKDKTEKAKQPKKVRKRKEEDIVARTFGSRDLGNN